MSTAPVAPAGAAARHELDIARMPHVRPRHWGRIVTAGLLLLLLALLVRAFALGQIAWPVVAQYLTWNTILVGLRNTILMALAAMAVGLVLGVLAAIARASPNPVLRSVALFYAWLFRGTPVILQLLLWFNLALVFPVIGIPGIWSERTVVVMTPFLAALLGLGLNQGAYTSEIVRAGMLSVDAGQYEAAKSIGLTYGQSLRRIILPQAMRVIVPPLGNEFIGLIKTTSLASVIQFTELLHNAENIYYANNRVIELLLVATFWYLVLVSVLSLGQALLEKRVSRGAARSR
jgi:polar amino acid transport system permease protein